MKAHKKHYPRFRCTQFQGRFFKLPIRWRIRNSILNARLKRLKGEQADKLYLVRQRNKLRVGSE